MKHSDFKDCPDCKLGFFFSYAECNDKWLFDFCSTCKGSMKTATKLIKIEIPDGYDIKDVEITDHDTFIEMCVPCYFRKFIKYPITPGPHSFICDVCGGTGYELNCSISDCFNDCEYKHLKFEESCEIVCPQCQGHPSLTADIKIEVIKKDKSYYFEITGREVL